MISVQVPVTLPLHSNSNDSNDRRPYYPRRGSIVRQSCFRSARRRASQEFDLKKVIFDECNIIEFSQVLGDNPSVTTGAPIAIGGDVQDQYTININIYEHTRKPLRRKSRKKTYNPCKEKIGTSL